MIMNTRKRQAQDPCRILGQNEAKWSYNGRVPLKYEHLFSCRLPSFRPLIYQVYIRLLGLTALKEWCDFVEGRRFEKKNSVSSMFQRPMPLEKQKTVDKNYFSKRAIRESIFSFPAGKRLPLPSVEEKTDRHRECFIQCHMKRLRPCSWLGSQKGSKTQESSSEILCRRNLSLAQTKPQEGRSILEQKSICRYQQQQFQQVMSSPWTDATEDQVFPDAILYWHYLNCTYTHWEGTKRLTLSISTPHKRMELYINLNHRNIHSVFVNLFQNHTCYRIILKKLYPSTTCEMSIFCEHTI